MDRCASPQAAPNGYTYSILIDCYRRAHRPDLGLAIFGRLLKTGLGLNVVAYNTVIDGFFKEGEVDKAYDLFREIKKQGIHQLLLQLASIKSDLGLFVVVVISQRYVISVEIKRMQ
ncbi:hypothetical protein GUJ93_ZPchr0229g18745 [Zizania palustris]|uniref:Pentatricopeptide repeat-containing protein n=1 Tax=Zizania palustris TaxID=103762 RepID=A0A8J5QVU3_ZIZPA|nr:hypothetical protein GUJ93_ZPchr0229g18745 [Zizania palustris]